MSNNLYFTSDNLTITSSDNETHTLQFEVRVYGIHNDVQVNTIIDNHVTGNVYNGNPNMTMCDNLKAAFDKIQNEIDYYEEYYDARYNGIPYNDTCNEFLNEFLHEVYCELKDNITSVYLSQNDPKAYERAQEAMKTYEAYKLPLNY